MKSPSPPLRPRGTPSFAWCLRRLVAGALLLSSGFAAGGEIFDTVVFGDTVSESAHALNAPATEVISGGLSQPARKMALDPSDTTVFEGGYLEFTAKCDPLKINYVTLKLWGSDTSRTASGILLLYQVQDGELLQVGYRDQQVSEYAPLAWATRPEAPIPGRFYYTTIPLPLSLTQGRTSVRLRILGSGMNANGSLPVYRAYVHGNAYFEPAPGDPQASPPAPAPIRPPSLGPLQAALDRARTTTIANMNGWLANNNGDLNQLVAGFNLAWTPAYRDPRVPPRVVANIDAASRRYFADPGSAGTEWGGSYGGEGERIAQIGAANFGAALDEVVDLGDPAGPAARRVLWAKMLKASRDAGRFGRRGPTTNQGIICDKEIYNANRGLLVLESPDAFTEEQAKRYLLEAVGLLPWKGPDLPAGGSNSYMGSNYFLVTPAGLTKENGYVSAYGEIYDVSTGYFGMTGDERFKAKGVEMLRARSYFRFPMVDADGYRSFMMVGPLDWRSHQSFPFDPAYGERGGRLSVAVATRDPHAIGYARQMFEDNQGGVFGTDLAAAQALEVFVSEPDSGLRLPMGEGEPDFAWADVDNGVVAIKRGEELTWIEPYWQSRTGLHSMARAMQITPTAARLATVRGDLQFTWSGNWSVKVDGTGWNGVPLSTPAGLVHQAYFNDKLLSATAPPGAQATREEFIGRASFYATRYGRYLVGINMDRTRSYGLKTPAGFTSAMDLITRETLSGPITVAPFSAVVLDLGANVDLNPRPHAPKFVDASGVPGAVAVYWETSGGGANYTVKRATSAAGPFATVASGLGGSYPKKWGLWPHGTYFDSAAAPGTTYYYKVSAVNAAGESYDSPVSKGGSPAANAASVNALPAPWKNVNFSNGGSASFNTGTGTFSLTGGGGDFWNTADGGHFVYQTTIGDGDLVARLTNLGGAYKTGVMIRVSLAANSPEISYVAQSGGLGGFRRGSVGGSTGFFASGDARPDPVWFRLQRRGSNVIVASASDAGGVPGPWITRGSGSLPVGTAAYVGIATTSGTPTFDNVSASGFGGTSATVPSAPGDLVATAANAAVALTWSPANLASTYTVKRASAAGGPYAVIASGLTTLGYTDSGRTNGTTYFYVVSATNPRGEGVNSSAASATPAAIPASPTNLAVTSSGTQAALSWTAASGATSYQVLRSSDGNSWTTVANVTGTTYTDSGLANGQSYVYSVVAVNGDGTSATAPGVAVTTIPAAPRLLEAAGAGTQAKIQWTAVAGASSYVVKRAATAGGPYTVVAANLPSPNHIDAALTRDAPYFYVVAAVNAAGEGAPSPEMKAGWGTGLLGRFYNNTNYGGTPVLTRIDPSIVFNWGQGSPDAVVNTDYYSCRWTGQFEAPVTGTYTFTSGNADDYFFLAINGITLAKSQTRTTNLVGGQKYDIQIDFSDNAGAAYFSVEYSVGADPPQPLPTSRLYPTPNRATGGTASAIAQSGTTESAARAFDGSAGSKWFTGVNGVAGWLRYRFATGVSWPVNRYTVTSANDLPARDPKSWDFQGSFNGSTWDTLDTQADQVFPGRGVTKTYLISNATAYPYYRFNVTANQGGSGYGIQVAEFGLYAPDTVPVPPFDLTATLGSQRVLLGWTTVSGAQGYVVKRSRHPGGPYVSLATVTSGSSFTDTDVANGLAYHYVVSTKSATGEGESSSEASVTLPAIPVPAPPTALAALAGDAMVDVSWAASSGAASYSVHRALGGGSESILLATGLTALTYRDTSAVNGTTYAYAASATNSSGPSEMSSPVSATPIGAAQIVTPQMRVVAGGTAQLTLATSVSGRTYQLQRNYGLTPNSWTAVGGPKPGGGSLSFSDAPDPERPAVFYRILIEP